MRPTYVLGKGRTEMKRNIFSVLAALLVAAPAVAAPLASSCAEQGRRCENYAQKNLPREHIPFGLAKCGAAADACKKQCNGGKSVFVGIDGHTEYKVNGC
jgi:hypothetical protein